MITKIIICLLISYFTHSNAFLWRYKYQKNIEDLISFNDRIYSSNVLSAPGYKHTEDDSEDLYFSQKLDHFDPKDHTIWKQRYFINDTFYVNRGPIFIFVEGESAASRKRKYYGRWIQLAQKFNAICFSLEHRYYGKSRPTSDTCTKQLKYLSAKQAIADIASFIYYVKIHYNLPKNSKVILFGGSYAGNLVAWCRKKYPYTVDGVISSSGPVLAKVNFPEYYEVIKKALASYDSYCPENLSAANEELAQLLEFPEGRDKVRRLFKICNPIKGNKKDVTSVVEILSDMNVAFLVQYNDRLRENTNGILSVSNFCKIMTSPGKSALKQYAKFNEIMLKYHEESCWNHDYTELINYYSNTNYDKIDQSGRLWFYQTCTEYGYYQTSESSKHLFGTYIPLDFYIQICSDIFESRFNNKTVHEAVRRTNNEYGGLNFRGSKVVFVHGTHDPWHSLGITQKPKRSNYHVFLLHGASHCTDLYPASEKDNKEKKKVHQKIQSILNLWIYR